LTTPPKGRQQIVWSALPPTDRPQAIRPHIHGRPLAPDCNGVGQPTAQLIAHVVIALSRYLRQLHADGGRVPIQIEELIAFLADRGRAPHDLERLNGRRTADGPPAMPRRLLITKGDAAELLGVSLRTIERLISAGRLPLVHVESAARIRVTDLEAYVQGLEPDGCGNASPADEPRSRN
jgi:excisionase family DNA binding protein